MGITLGAKKDYAEWPVLAEKWEQIEAHARAAHGEDSSTKLPNMDLECPECVAFCDLSLRVSGWEPEKLLEIEELSPEHVQMLHAVMAERVRQQLRGAA